MIAGLDFKKAIKNALLMNVGMFGAKFFALRFGLNSTETDPSAWTWRSYIQAGLGGAGVALLVNSIKPGRGQRVLEGAMAYTLFKIAQNEGIQKNPTMQKYLGGYDGMGFGGVGYTDPNILPLDGEDEVVLVDESGNQIPLSEEYRMNGGGMGSVLLPVGRLGEEDDYPDMELEGYYGDALVDPSPLGEDDEDEIIMETSGVGNARADMLAAYKSAWQG